MDKIQVIENNVAWASDKLDAIRVQLDMLIDYLDKEVCGDRREEQHRGHDEAGGQD